MSDENEAKVSFRLEQDEDGYPPVSWERLWAERVRDDLYRLDNVPFYVKGVSSGDVVATEKVDEELVFRELVEPSAN